MNMKKSITVSLLAAIAVGVKAQDQATIKINSQAAVVQSQEIIINSKPDVVWQVLTGVEDWPSWNEKVTKTSVKEKLQVGSVFSWKSGGVNIHSKLHSYIDQQVMGWTGQTIGAKAVHNWHLIPTEKGTKVLVEESMDGWLVGLLKKSMNKKLEADMIFWLSQLKLECEKPAKNAQATL